MSEQNSLKNSRQGNIFESEPLSRYNSSKFLPSETDFQQNDEEIQKLTNSKSISNVQLFEETTFANTANIDSVSSQINKNKFTETDTSSAVGVGDK